MVATRRSADKAPGFLGRHSNVYLYVPNLIGYARIAFALYAFAVALHSPTHCFLAYFLSFVCDELDGRFARMLNQCSTLGQVLDMVTDRVATSCLLAVLCVLYPRLLLPLLALLMLDIFSHWFQMYSTLAMGSASHKDVHSRSFVVRFYYRNRIFMGFCCVCCEVLYLMAYLGHWPEYRAWAAVPLPAPLAPLLKGYVPEGGVPLVAIVGLLSVPGVAIKQLVNVVQLKAAMAQMVRYDQAAQAAAQGRRGGGSK